MDLAEVLAAVKAELPRGRYEHTVRVVAQAKELAEQHEIDQRKAGLAAAFHDYAKKRSLAEMKRIILASDLPKDLLLYHHELWHGPVAAILVKAEFGITDSDVLNAIRYHTTGRARMSDLEMLISLADYIEPARRFAGLDDVREMSQIDLTQAAFLMSQKTIQFLMQQGSPIYPDTFHSYNYLAKQLAERDVLR